MARDDSNFTVVTGFKVAWPSTTELDGVEHWGRIRRTTLPIHPGIQGSKGQHEWSFSYLPIARLTTTRDSWRAIVVKWGNRYPKVIRFILRCFSVCHYEDHPRDKEGAGGKRGRGKLSVRGTSKLALTWDMIDKKSGGFVFAGAWA